MKLIIILNHEKTITSFYYSFLSFGQNLGFDVVTVDTTIYHQGCSWNGSPIAYTVPEGKVAKIQYAYPWNFSVNGIEVVRAVGNNSYYTIHV